jgi:integrase
MTVRREERRGRRVLVIDIPYRAPDGRWTRYRRDAVAATIAAAREEERRVRERIGRTGSPFEASDAASPARKESTFSEVVTRYRRNHMRAKLKPTTRRGYEAVIELHLVPRFGPWPISKVDGKAATELDLALAGRKHRRGRGMKQSTRNNVQTVLRSVLSFALREGLVAVGPTGLPKLRRVGESVLEIPTDDEVRAILKAARPAPRVSLALMAYAGLRPNEVRGLRRREIKLEREGRVATGGFLTVRTGVSYGESHSPKTGERVVPITRPLAGLLATLGSTKPNAYAATTSQGGPWGQHGLDRAFKRIIARLGLKGWSVYCLRHYAITSWLRANVPVHVVQRMAGHSNLSTTQRYAHYVRADLRDAATRIGNMLETPQPAPA